MPINLKKKTQNHILLNIFGSSGVKYASNWIYMRVFIVSKPIQIKNVNQSQKTKYNSKSYIIECI